MCISFWHFSKMLPSRGLFKDEPCPFYESTGCDRPYCHFRHKKNADREYFAYLREAIDQFPMPPKADLYIGDDTQDDKMEGNTDREVPRKNSYAEKPIGISPEKNDDSKEVQNVVLAAKKDYSVCHTSRSAEELIKKDEEQWKIEEVLSETPNPNDVKDETVLNAQNTTIATEEKIESVPYNEAELIRKEPCSKSKSRTHSEKEDGRHQSGMEDRKHHSEKEDGTPQSGREDVKNHVVKEDNRHQSGMEDRKHHSEKEDGRHKLEMEDRKQHSEKADVKNHVVKEDGRHQSGKEDGKHNSKKSRSKKPTSDQMRKIEKIVSLLKESPHRVEFILTFLESDAKTMHRNSESRSSSSSNVENRSSKSHSKSSRSRSRHNSSDSKKTDSHSSSRLKESKSSERRKSSSSSSSRKRKHSVEEVGDLREEKQRIRLEEVPSPTLEFDVEDNDDDEVETAPDFPVLKETGNASQVSVGNSCPSNKVKICPVFNVSRMLKTPPQPKRAFGQPIIRVQHDGPESNPFSPIAPEGSLAVPRVKRQFVMTRLYETFTDMKTFRSRCDASDEAFKCEAALFEKHKDNFRKYQLALPTLLTSIRLGRYFSRQEKGTSEKEMYDLLLPLILTEDQLLDNGYPVKVDGKYIVHHNLAFGFNKKWRVIKAAYEKDLRYCTRCSVEYAVGEDHLQLVPNCVFHSERKRTRRGDSSYPCCNGEKGCQIEPFHITEQLHDNMTSVARTRPSSDPEMQKKVFALDCEMVATTHGMELAHVVVVDSNGRSVYDSLCKPTNKVTSYLTKYSGITEEMLNSANKDLKMIQKDLLKLFNDETILIGHSLDSDFRALELSHLKVVDTSVVYPPYEVNGAMRKKSLKRLANEILFRPIQEAESGHSAAEDAIASLDLAKKKAGII